MGIERGEVFWGLDIPVANKSGRKDQPDELTRSGRGIYSNQYQWAFRCKRG